jgi:hypothetical protein
VPTTPSSFRSPTFSAIYRLASRPYALSATFGAAGRTQLATIHHAANATKTVKIRLVEVAIESSSAAAIVELDLVRITTAPATGNPAITPTPYDPADAAAEVTCLALPTTGGTEGALYASEEWNLGITGAASTAAPPPPLTYQTIYQYPEGGEQKAATIRAATLEGFAVVADASAATTLKGFVIVTFTEET